MRKGKGFLEKRIIRALIIGAVALAGLVSVSASLAYTYMFFMEYKKNTKNMVNYAVSLLDEDYLKELYETTRVYYQTGPEGPGEDSFSDEYLAHLRKNPLLQQDKFWEQREILAKCRSSMGLNTLALCFADQKENRLVFVLDGDELGRAYLPGNWISPDRKDMDVVNTINEILQSKWRMKIDYGTLSGWILANYVEVTTEDGEVLGVALVNTEVSEPFRMAVQFFWGTIPGLILIIAALAFFSDRFLKKRIVTPMLTLSKAAENYTAREKAENEEETAFFKSLQLQTGDEIEILSNSLSRMEEDINDTMKRIRKIRLEKERMNAELELAKRIQADQLPRKFPPFPDRRDFDIYASMTPAKEVGGDFYDFFLTDENHIALVVADVSDKGVPAALFMMVARNLLNSALKNGLTPAQALDTVNRRLLENNDEMQFVTVWLTLVDLRTGEGLVCNAGHEKPYLKESGKGYVCQKYGHFLPLAVGDWAEYEDLSFRLSPGDALFCYTDGVPEATREDGELYGSERLLSALNREPEADPKRIIEIVDEDIRSFRGDAPQFDDITMLCFTYKGKEK